MKKIVFALLIILPASIFSQSYQEFVEKAMDQIEQKDYIAAEQSFREALRKEPANPTNTMLIVNLGTVLRYLNKYDEALVSYDAAIENHPNVNFLRHNRALLYCDMGKYDDALRDFNAILLSDPKYIEALYQRGLIYIQSRNLLAAEEDFDAINEIDATSILYKQGAALLHKCRLEWAEAEKIYTELIEKHPHFADLYYKRAECYFEINNLSKMQRDLSKAVELGYDRVELYVLRGQMRLAQYDKLSAKQDFLKAKEKGADEKLIEKLLLKCK